MRLTLLLGLLLMLAMESFAEPYIVAHRGGAGERDENTLFAFQEAYEKGIRAYETDIRITADDQLVISHDASLKRTCDRDVNVEAMTLAECQAVLTKAGHAISSFDSLLAFLQDKPDVVLQVEIKAPGDASRRQKLVEVMVRNLTDRKFLDGRLLVISFNLEALKETKAANPDIRTGLLYSGCDKKVYESAREAKCDWLSLEVSSTTRAFINQAHRDGLKVACWTIRGDQEFNLARALLADAIVTDFPVKYQAALKAAAALKAIAF